MWLSIGVRFRRRGWIEWGLRLGFRCGLLIAVPIEMEGERETVGIFWRVEWEVGCQRGVFIETIMAPIFSTCGKIHNKNHLALFF